MVWAGLTSQQYFCLKLTSAGKLFVFQKGSFIVVIVIVWEVVVIVWRQNIM